MISFFSIPKYELIIVLSHFVKVIPNKFSNFINYCRSELKIFLVYACYLGNNSI